MRPKRLLFVAVAGSETGYGHLSRCLTLAACARDQGASSSFLVFGDESAAPRVSRAGFPCSVYPYGALETPSSLGEQPADAAVADVSHPVVFSRLDSSRMFLRHLRAKSRALMVIDAMGSQALAAQMPDMPADLVAMPYVGAEPDTGRPWRTLAGPRYAVLAAEYAGLPPRIVGEAAERVLVTCGGSDPAHLTLLVLDALESIPAHLEVRVVVGPLFARKLSEAVAAKAARSRHSVLFVDAPECLAGQMLWSDLAVATSGLVKYELAATSTPAVLLSIDSSHAEVNRPFAEVGSTRDIGANFTSRSVAQAVGGLLGDSRARAAMAAAGRRLVDGKGADRLIGELMRICNVAE